MARDAGFEGARAWVAQTPLTLPPPADFLWQYINLTPMEQFVSQAPATAQAAMEDQVVAEWQEFVEDGRTVISQPMVLLTAVKVAG